MVSLSIKVVNTLLAFFISALLARILGVSGFGLYTFALTLTMLAAVPMHTALSHLAVRETAKFKSNKSLNSILLLIAWADRLSLVYFICVFTFVCLTWVLFNLLTPVNNPDIIPAVVIGLVLVFTMPLTATRASALRGLGFVNLGQIPDAILRPGLFVLAVTLVLFFFSSQPIATNAHAAMILHGVGGIIALVTTILLVHKYSGLGANSSIVRICQPFKRQTNAAMSIPWRNSLVSLYSLAFLQLANSSIDSILLGLFRENSELGVYRVAVQLSTLVGFGLMAINPILHGSFSYLYHEKRSHELQELVTKAAFCTVVLALPPLFVLMFFGRALIELTFGSEFTTALTALHILLIGQAANIFAGAVASLLNMTGHELETLYAMLTAIALNIVVSLILVPSHGATGAALANSVGLAFWNIILWRRVRHCLGVDSSIIGVAKFLISKFRRQEVI